MKTRQINLPKNNLLRFVTLIAAVMLFTGKVDPAGAAGLLVADGGFGGALEIIEHDVQVTINNGIAVTQVSQVFLNKENRQVEALYTFPVPKGASVSNFSMWINGKEMVGEVLEKKRAREIYDSYKQRRKDPGLLEQTNYKTFEMRIFPIAPNAQQRVQVTYYQELDIDHDWATYVYPLATTTRTGIDNRVSGRFSIAANIKSAIPISAVQSPSHPDAFLMVAHTENYHEASLENRDGDLARDVVLAFQVTRPVTGLDLLTAKTDGDDGYFALTLTAGQELEKMQTGADYVFILDISGSMANEGKLNTSVHSLDSFIKSLGPDDRFEVITFNKKPFTLFNHLVAPDQGSVSQAVSFLASQEARGGTSLEPAMAIAYKYGTDDRPLNTVILSDGMTEQNERRILMDIIQSRPANIRVFCIGVGNEINRSLLRQLAEDAGGLAAFISSEDDFDRQAQAFRRKLMHPVASNLQIKFSGVEVYDIEPERLPSLYHGMPVRMYGRYKGQGSARVEVSAEVNGRQISTTAEMDFPGQNNDNPEIERMWAWQRMEGLKRQHEMSNNPALVDEIVRLGEGYSITSEYTSFLVLENDAEYQRWKIDRRNATRIQRDRKAQERLRLELEALRTKALSEIGPMDTDNPAKVQQPVQVATRAPQRSAPQAIPQASPASSPGPSRSFDMPQFSGGGAMDPVSALIGVALAGGAVFGRRKKK
ncbi:MAG: VIT and VWA domain-containing protein [Desulfobulbaceae bacterium]|nr:VIT and VWA domain-containing protein [Desulfobulbaceae bacterium]